MADKIYVLHVVGRMDRGGTEALLMSLLRTIDRNRFQFDFVEQTQDICNYDDEILELGAKIYRCPNLSPANINEYRNWWKKFYIEHPQYKIIHGHSRGSAPIYLKEAQKSGRIAIAHCHNNSHGKGLKGLIRYLWQIPLRNLADYNLACSYDSGISQYGKNGKFEIIKNGIQTERFKWNPDIRNKVRQDLKIDNNFVVGNVARFEEQKNHKFLLQIFKEIVKMRSDAKLLLVGQGTKENEIHQLAANLGIEDKIIYTGVRNDVNELMQAMDVFVLPSFFEGLGIVNIEAQTAGLSCFASDKVVPLEVNLTNLMHYIPLTSPPDEWARQILSHAKSVDERKDMSKEIMKAGFDILSTKNRLENFYEEVLKNAE